MKDNGKTGHYDVSFGLASVALTSTGLVVVTTTGGSYHGLRLIAGTTQVTVLAFDNASATTGNILDVVRVSPGGNSYDDRFNPVYAKKGITLGIVGTGATGVVFYSPKG